MPGAHAKNDQMSKIKIHSDDEKCLMKRLGPISSSLCVVRILQIKMVDHVIVGQPFGDRPGYFSFKESGMI